MAILTEVWAADIAEKLFPSNSFVSKGINDDAWVSNKKVHLPQAGANPSVVRNRNSNTAATATKREDDDLEYNVDAYTTNPTLVEDIEEIETSYLKRQSILRGHIASLNTSIAEWMAYHWSPTKSDRIVRTSGDSRGSTVKGATGNRKKTVLADLLKAKTLLDGMDVPMKGRWALIPSDMYKDLLEIDKVLSAEYNQTGRLPDGVVNKIFGINLMVRSSSASYTNAATPVLRTPSASDLTTANNAIIIWHEDFVRRAKGEVKVYENEDDATLYGSVFSAMARSGGAKAYKDEIGVVAIVESAA